MRERLIAAFVLVAVLVLVAFAVTRAYSVNGLVQREEARKVERAATLLSAVVDERRRNGERVTGAYLARFLEQAERVEYVAADGTRTAAAAAGYRAARSDQDIVRSHPVPGGGTLTLARSGHLVEQRIADALLPLVLIGLFLSVVAAGLGYLAARWISRPFQELARVAGELGRGRFDLQVPHFSVPEAETVGRAMQKSAVELRELVRREREFASNASHQLRTPITALRLELEDLTLWKETPPTVVEQLNRSLRELDRLSVSVSRVLERARGQRVGSAVDMDVTALAHDTVSRWRPRAASAGREIALVTPGVVAVRLAPGPIEQVLDVLVDNALRHGSGSVTVDVSQLDTHVRIRVRDQGDARVRDDVFLRREGTDGVGAGDGLAVAAEVSDALGGYLTADGGPVTSFSLMLPRP